MLRHCAGCRRRCGRPGGGVMSRRPGGCRVRSPDVRRRGRGRGAAVAAWCVLVPG
ncbi:hypothetical protein HBB16_05875 [Pseudonocardia sp. MCCB 268]|nr:hypothetical protein [Pseudonocardia cytotoxica]